MIKTFEKGLAAGPWILGRRFSAADVMLGSSAAFMKQFKLLPNDRAIEECADRRLARKAYQEALAGESI
jgi:glutathione S-transferase